MAKKKKKKGAAARRNAKSGGQPGGRPVGGQTGGADRAGNKASGGLTKNQRQLIMGVCVVVCIVVLLVALSQLFQKNGGTTETAASDGDGTAVSGDAGAPDGETAEVGNYLAEIDVEDYGTITLELDGETAPVTVRNFVDLAESGFYDGLTFHRIMEGFMIQGGDPDGNGFGGSDETIRGEFSSNGYQNDISHVRGVISMARANDPDSASSQFFIVQQDSTFLDGNYAAFGHVIDGMDVVDAIAEDAEPIDDNGTIPAEAQPVIRSITVQEITDAVAVQSGGD